MCILCKMNIIPDYKNTRMLSQFISRFTGRIYGRHITGLCRHKQEHVEKEIKKSREAGQYLMKLISTVISFSVNNYFYIYFL